MLALMKTLPIRRVALILGAIAVLSLASGSLVGAPRAPALAQAEETAPLVCGDSFGGNCSWTS
jgi:hypothetical protein